MGRQNQQRRTAKKRRREEARRRRAGSRPGAQRVAGHETDGAVLDALVVAAVAAVGAAQRALILDELAAAGRPAVAAACRLLDQSLAAAHGRGWSTQDLVHVVTRRLSVLHARLAAGEPLAEPLPVTHALRCHVELLALLGRLSAVPVTGGGRAAAVPSRGLDPRVLTRVRGLLAKAESTDFPEEAEALTAKAQELIARHAIDAVLLHDDDPGRPASRRVYIDDPYVDAKALLLERVASANRCRAVQSPAYAWSTVFGYDADLDAVELLMASLLAQATRGLARHGSFVDRSGRSRTRSFRRSFLVGFAHRIGQRLRETTDAQVAAADAGAGQLLPVLAARDAEVQAVLAEAFPDLVSRATSISNPAGWAAGQSAADAADLSLGSGMLDARADRR